jgi:RNA polymerase sigma-70 factor, ECF subfamily
MSSTINPKYIQYQNLTDIEIIDSTLNKNKENYEGIILRYESQLQAYLYRLLNFNYQDAQDCLSQTFVQAYTKLTSYQKERSFSSWIYRIAHNLAIDHIRKHSGKTNSFDPESISHIPAKSPDPFISKLDFILNKLSSEDKNLLILFYVQGMSLNELSDIYNLLPNTISVRLKRAKEKAKKLITQYYAQ